MTIDTDTYLERLNAALRSHPQYEEGMAFTAVYPSGFALLDPRLLEMQHSHRPHDFSDEPFVAAIRAVADATKGGGVSMDGPCPVCGAASGSGYTHRDATLIVCPNCGGYQLAGTALAEFETGALPKPDPERFRALVKAKRGESAEYPVITTYDIRGIL